jgi:MFS transporter, putative metabolite:H+ symporter
VTLVAGLAFASNGMTLGILAYALLGLRAAWGLTTGQATALTMAMGAGQLVGGLVMGHIADSIGRRLGYAATLTLSSTATGASALAPSLAWLIPLTFLAGCGFGGVAPIATSLVSEFAPARERGTLMGWTQVIWMIGWLTAAVAGVLLIHTLGWRGIFAIGILPVVLAVVGPRLTPESPRFLLAQGRRQEAEDLIAQLRARFDTALEIPDQEQSRRVSVAAHLAELWSPRFRRRTAMLWTVWFAMIGTAQGPVLWFPAMMAGAGIGHAAELSLLIGVVTLVLTLASTHLVDRLGRKPVMIIGLAIGSAGAVGAAVARTASAFVLGGTALTGGTLAAWPAILSYAAELYPTRIRATATGWAAAAGRTAAILAPAMLGILMPTWTRGRGLAMAVFAVALGGAALIVLVLGEETAGRSLEEIADVGGRPDLRRTAHGSSP